MRLSSAWTTIALVIIAVSAFAFVPAAAHAAPGDGVATSAHGPPIHPHPAAAVGISTTDQFGGSTSDFYVGLSQSQVAFWAYDFSADRNATVTVHDYNHTRDGLPDPVWTHRISFQGSSYNYSYNWNIYYQIPITLTAPGTWNITINGTLGGFAFQNFTVHTYYASIYAGQTSLLSGHTSDAEYYVSASVNDARYGGLTDLTASVLYFKGGNWTPISGFPKSLGTAAWGTFPFTVPANVTGTVLFYLWANVSANGTKWSELATNSQALSSLSSPFVTLTQCPEGCGGGTFQAGSTLYLSISTRSTTGGAGVPTPDLHVRVSFERGSTGVSLAGVQTNFTSNATGEVALEFPAAAPPFGLNVTNWVVVNITDPLNPVAPAQVVKIGFDLTLAPRTPRMAVTLDASSYFGGETATATWTIQAQNGSTAFGWVANFWYVYQTSPYVIVAEGAISGTATTGMFTFPVPNGYSGALEVVVETNNATESSDASTEVWVGAAAVLLSPSEEYYAPGDTINVGVATDSLPSTAQLLYTVVDSSGAVQASGTVAGGSITVKIPTVSPPSYVYVNVVAQDSVSGAVITKAYIEVSLGSQLLVVAGVSTKSNYADGSFQPGQTISVTYTISTVAGYPTPKWFYVTVCSIGVYYCGPGSTYVETSSTSGSLSYKIPSNTPSGSQTFEVYVESIACGGYSYCYNGASFSVAVNSAPSALEYELGAGSGVTLGWLILLILIIVVALLLFLVGRRRSRGGSSSSSSPPTAWTSPSSGSTDTASSSSPSGSGSSSGAPADSGAPSGSGAPPLPNPK